MVGLKSMMIVLVVFTVASFQLQSTVAQKRHVVGDALGWTIPPNGEATYATWASQRTFKVGDTLVFNFTTGFHTVAEVSQAAHVVGDALGWTIPPNGEATYATWASQRTFKVGDTLVFNFTTGFHTVAEVSQAAYGPCSLINILSLNPFGPATVTLTQSGAHYFICTIISHCQLVVVVFMVLASFQLPSTVAQTSHVVGDSMGWTVPPTNLGATAYTSWATGKTFRVGDTLVFNFPTNVHNVLEVSQSAYQPCTLANPITTVINGPANITLTAGNHYYICGVGPHCRLGQKVMVTVVGASGSTPPAATSPATSPPPPSPSSASTLMAVVPVAFLAALALVF
nr:hypothetical protein [Tanacetum cinerariifolium]